MKGGDHVRDGSLMHSRSHLQMENAGDHADAGQRSSRSRRSFNRSINAWALEESTAKNVGGYGQASRNGSQH